MSLIEINNLTKQPIDLRLVKRAIKEFLKLHHLANKEVSVALVDDKTITKLNRVYLGVAGSTDVLAFSGENNYLGEIIIGYPQIKRQAQSYKNTVERELIFILIHGLLHLFGYDDKTVTAKKEMERLSDKFFRNFKFYN